MFRRKRSKEYTVVVNGDYDVNNLGVVRALGRHGIPTLLCSSSYQNVAKYSRYINNWLRLPDPTELEDEYIASLMDLGKQTESKCIIIPTSDGAVMALSKHKAELEQYFILPFPSFEIVEKFVNKRMFYQLMEQMSVPYPKTYFTEDLNELKTVGKETAYPYIIKPSHMHRFTAAFTVKCFFIDSSQKLNHAIQKLEDKDLDVFIQEIIPGKELYSLSTYLNKKSEPLSICGYDKLKQDPPDFGVGTILKSNWREGPINSAIEVLRYVDFYGIAETEFIRDQRDGQYKCLEVNARSTVPNSLLARCGADINYIAYQDIIGRYNGNLRTPESGVFWINEIVNILNIFERKSDNKIGAIKSVIPFKRKRVYAIAAWDDPIPFFFALSGLGYRFIRKTLRIIKAIFRITARKNTYKNK